VAAGVLLRALENHKNHPIPGHRFILELSFVFEIFIRSSSRFNHIVVYSNPPLVQICKNPST
jgi:hypothetical protein